jgi:DNA segregation ATPase FtsK/SpoIIIE, S-DNA-T family
MAAERRAAAPPRASRSGPARGSKRRKAAPRPWWAGWHLPGHLWFDSAAVLSVALLTLLVVAAFPLLPDATARPVQNLHAAERALLGGSAVLLPLLLLAVVVTVVRFHRFDARHVPWLRFLGMGTLLGAWVTLVDGVAPGRGGFVGAELRALVGDLLGPFGWLVWLAAVLIGLIWALRLSLPVYWQAVLHFLRAGRWSLRASSRAATPAVRALKRSLERKPALAQGTTLPMPPPAVQPALPLIKTVAPIQHSAPTLPAEPVKKKREAQRLAPENRSGIAWRLPDSSMLKYGTRIEASQESIYARSDLIVQTLADFGIAARVQEIRPGPTVTQFGVRPDPGVKVARIVGLQNDLALAMEAYSIRVEAPVPGKPYVGIEVPNPVASPVTLRELLESQEFTRFRAKGARLPIIVGSDVAGEPVFGDLTRMPHLLIAGATGSGKSSGINALICCLLFQCTPDELQLLMVDPKQVELAGYNGIPHLKAPVIVDVDKVVGALDWCIQEMERRYALFAKGSFRDILRYNAAAIDRGEAILPYVVVIIDELADLMMTAPEQVEQQICRLAQKARAIGIHLVVATQRPSVDVITGLIKANFPSRIAYAVSSGVDSKTILDSPGAERLLGRGDMLYTPSDALRPMRVQGTYVYDDEIEALITFWRTQRTEQGDRWQSPEEQHALLASWATAPQEDPERRLLEETLAVLQVVAETAQQQGKEAVVTLSLLQRRLRLGQSRASLLMDELVDQGYVGPPRGPTKARPILLPLPPAAEVAADEEAGPLS